MSERTDGLASAFEAAAAPIRLRRRSPEELAEKLADMALALFAAEHERREVQSALDRVRGLHRPGRGVVPGEQVCADCGDTVPCRTERAIRGTP